MMSRSILKKLNVIKDPTTSQIVNFQTLFLNYEISFLEQLKSLNLNHVKSVNIFF